MRMRHDSQTPAFPPDRFGTGRCASSNFRMQTLIINELQSIPVNIFKLCFDNSLAIVGRPYLLLRGLSLATFNSMSVKSFSVMAGEKNPVGWRKTKTGGNRFTSNFRNYAKKSKIKYPTTVHGIFLLERHRCTISDCLVGCCLDGHTAVALSSKTLFSSVLDQ